MKQVTRLGTISLLCALLVPAASARQASPIPAEDIRKLVVTLKSDPRGPYQAIRWFCTDGSVRPASTPCNEPGGVQHALLKDEVVRLQQQGLYLGQILTGTPPADFWDAGRHFARLKGYQVEQFLRAVDDGWILRRAQYYRGAFQAEDEEAWGRAFFDWALSDDARVRAQFYLLREAARDVPHTDTNHTLQQIRARSKAIADAYPAFMDLRIKIHGRPDAGDVARVRAFREAHRAKLTADLLQQLDALEADMRRVYLLPDAGRLTGALRRLPPASPLTAPVRDLAARLASMSAPERGRALADLIWLARTTLTEHKTGRMSVLDLSLELEALLFKTASDWQPKTIGEVLEKGYVLARAAAGTGLLEQWEWTRVEALIKPPATDESLSLDAFRARVETLRNITEWSIGMTLATYEAVVHDFAAFEPLAQGFTDDRMRASVLLPLGEVAGMMSNLLAEYAGFSNAVMDLADAGQMRGLNAGIALGRLEVITGSPDTVNFSSDKIYVLTRAPAELKPVAGIATVSEGNVVSHVQLLARNLGIPNAVLKPQHVQALLRYSGEMVFYAVSPRGVVRMKRAADMTPAERALVEERKRSTERIRVPIDRMDLETRALTSLYDLRASDSGRLSGPKAANLGELSHLFPGHVAPGFIIPFGVFRRHMNQPMPGTGGSYWDYLQATFSRADAARAHGATEDAIDAAVLERLSVLRGAGLHSKRYEHGRPQGLYRGGPQPDGTQRGERRRRVQGHPARLGLPLSRTRLPVATEIFAQPRGCLSFDPRASERECGEVRRDDYDRVGLR